ncbi:hypothetical protein [Lysobacter sp. A289]
MQPKTMAVISIGLSVAMMMPLHAAQQTQAEGPVMRAANPQLQQIQPVQKLQRAPRRGDLELVPGQLSRPVITDPTDTSNMCCAQNYGSSVWASSEFDIHGEGVPGHLIKVRVDLNNDGSSYRVANKWTTVGEDGLWKVRWIEVSTKKLKGGAFIEINADQIFPATEVRQPDGVAKAKPIRLEYRIPSRPAMGAASSSG